MEGCSGPEGDALVESLDGALVLLHGHTRIMDLTISRIWTQIYRKSFARANEKECYYKSDTRKLLVLSTTVLVYRCLSKLMSMLSIIHLYALENI